jgi:hypothetical protein
LPASATRRTDGTWLDGERHGFSFEKLDDADIDAVRPREKRPNGRVPGDLIDAVGNAHRAATRRSPDLE